ncbi:MAG: hypothetical protein ACPGN3_13490 [Opitutales bacterium]
MSSPKTLLLLSLLIFLGFDPSISAREIRAIFLNGSQDSPQTAYLHSKEFSETIHLPRKILSPSTTVPNGNLSFAVLSQAPAEEEEVLIPENAQIVTIPKEWTRCILLFVPKSQNTEFPAAVYPINASGDSFPSGHTMIYNFSQNSIAGKFGEQVVMIAAGSKAIIGEPREGRGSYRVDMACELPTHENPVVFYGTSWMHYPDRKQLMFITPPTGNRKTPTIRLVLDSRTPSSNSTS